MTAEPLTEWTLLALDGPVPQGVAGRTVPATVPGTVHTDLLAAGLIPDPYLDENEAALQWVGRTSWRYATTLAVVPPEDGEHVELVFDGLDTVCEVRLGDHVLGTPRNQHRAYRFDVTDLVRAGETELVVDFAAQLTATEQASLDQTAADPHQRPSVQRDPQDGVQLRLGLGTRPRDRRPLAGGAGRAVAHGPAAPPCEPWSRWSTASAGSRCTPTWPETPLRG